MDVGPAELGDAEGRPRRPGAELGALGGVGPTAGRLPVSSAARRCRLLRLFLLVLAFI